MKRSLPFFFMLVCLLATAQKEDYTWLAGYDSWAGYDTNWQYTFGISRLDFNHQPVALTRDSLGINFARANAIISDSNGQYLFSCNGVKIRDRFDHPVESGDTLGWGTFLSYTSPNSYYFGQYYNLLLQVLTDPVNPKVYDLFYVQIDTVINGVNLCGKRTLRARLDMNANGGLGKVLEKDVVVSNRINNISLASVRHGNGRDWWIAINPIGNNCTEVISFNGSDSLYSHLDCGGGTTSQNDLASGKFSPDGTRFVQVNSSGVLNVFDFDRCIGALSLREQIDIPEIRDSLYWLPTGVEFSPDSRFAYIFCQYRIFQFDMQANPIANSRVAVGTYQGSPGPIPVTYDHGQLAPDGKIYVNSGNGCYYIGVIENPNGQGLSCNFLDHSIQLPTFIMGLPYYPNYRLGALSGSPCDTLTSLPETSSKESLLHLYPSPATSYIVIDYGFTDWSKGEAELEITNDIGQVMHRQKLPMYSGFQKLDVSHYASGLYTAAVKRGNRVVSIGKFAKE